MNWDAVAWVWVGFMAKVAIDYTVAVLRRRDRDRVEQKVRDDISLSKGKWRIARNDYGEDGTDE